jgi:hypothetical protein
MKFLKSNLFYILVAIIAMMLLLAYIFDKGEILGRALAN